MIKEFLLPFECDDAFSVRFLVMRPVPLARGPVISRRLALHLPRYRVETVSEVGSRADPRAFEQRPTRDGASGR